MAGAPHPGQRRADSVMRADAIRRMVRTPRRTTWTVNGLVSESPSRASSENLLTLSQLEYPLGGFGAQRYQVRRGDDSERRPRDVTTSATPTGDDRTRESAAMKAAASSELRYSTTRSCKAKSLSIGVIVSHPEKSGDVT